MIEVKTRRPIVSDVLERIMLVNSGAPIVMISDVKSREDAMMRWIVEEDYDNPEDDGRIIEE